MNLFIRLFSIMSLLSVFAFAGDFEEGIKGLNNNDYKTAYISFLKDAELGGASSQYNLGSMYAKGQGVPKNYIKASYWYKKAADSGNINAQYELALMYRHGLLPDEKKNELKYLRMAADNEHPEAQYILGIKYETGEEVVQNWIEAVKWYEKAAINGEILAQEKIGFLFFKGDVVKKDLDKSFFYLNKAAKNGSNEAKYVLSVMYSHGFSIHKNDKESLKMLYDSDANGGFVWIIEFDNYNNKDRHLICADNLQTCKIEKTTVEYIRSLADKGDSKAQYVLGNMYYYGEDIQHNYYLSSKYLLQAAKNGLQKAYIRFGELFDDLYKYEQYLIYQYALYNLALGNNRDINEESHIKNNLERIEKKLSMTEILEAQRLSVETNELWNKLDKIIETQK